MPSQSESVFWGRLRKTGFCLAICAGLLTAGGIYPQRLPGPDRSGLTPVWSRSAALAADSTNQETVANQQREERYQELLRQKEAFTNNRSYQKRKIKRKYKHKPQIQEMIEAEKRLDAEIESIEAQAPELKRKYARPESEPPQDSGGY